MPPQRSGPGHPSRSMPKEEPAMAQIQASSKDTFFLTINYCRGRLARIKELWMCGSETEPGADIQRSLRGRLNIVKVKWQRLVAVP
jgi:hypothetical protein